MATMELKKLPKVERAAAGHDLKEDWRRMDPVRSLCCFGGPKRDCGAGKNAFLLNPKHRDFAKIKIRTRVRFSSIRGYADRERRDLQDCSGLQRKLLLNLILLILLIVSMRSTAIPFISLGCIVALQAQTPISCSCRCATGCNDSFSRSITGILPTSSGTTVPVPQSTPPKLTDILFKNFKARSIGPAAWAVG